MLIWIILVLFLPFLRSLVVAHELNKEEAPLLRWPQENPEFLQLGKNIPEKNNPRAVQTVFSGLPPAARLGALGGLGGFVWWVWVCCSNAVSIPEPDPGALLWPRGIFGSVLRGQQRLCSSFAPGRAVGGGQSHCLGFSSIQTIHFLLSVLQVVLRDTPDMCR